MKFKALRKKETKEFVEIEYIDSIHDYLIFTSEFPKLQPITVNIELMKKYYEQTIRLPEHIVLDDFEFIELEVIEADTVGADIRNKLSPPKNLVELLERYFSVNIAHASEERTKLAEIIKKEMKQTKISVDYLAKLL